MPYVTVKITEKQREFLLRYKQISGRAMSDIMRDSLIAFIIDTGTPPIQLQDIVTKLDELLAQSNRPRQPQIHSETKITEHTINYETTGKFENYDEKTTTEEVKTNAQFLQLKKKADASIKTPTVVEI